MGSTSGGLDHNKLGIVLLFVFPSFFILFIAFCISRNTKKNGPSSRTKVQQVSNNKSLSPKIKSESEKTKTTNKNNNIININTTININNNNNNNNHEQYHSSYDMGGDPFTTKAALPRLALTSSITLLYLLFIIY